MPKPPKINAPSHANQAIVMVAVYEIIKGGFALLAALMIWRWHAQLPYLAHAFIDKLHHLVGTLFVAQLQQLTEFADSANRNWHKAFWLVIGYAALRFMEAYGLYHDKAWAYWYSVLGYAIFVPVEVYYLMIEPFDWVHLGVLLLNLVIVIVVYRNMQRKGLL